MAEGEDILLGFVADTKAALDQVLAMVRGMSAGLLTLGETHPEVVINIANAAESLRTLLADLEAVRRGEQDLSGQPLTINTTQVAERLDAVLGMLRGLNEEFLRLPDVAATAGAGVASAADRIAESERLATEGAAALRSELAAVAQQAEVSGEEEAASQRPLIEAAAQARAALSELYRSVANGSRSVVEEFTLADRAIGEFEARLRAAAAAGEPIGVQLPAELARLQAGLLAVATDAERAGVAIRGVAVAEREAGAAGAAAGAESGGLGLLSRAFNRIAFSIELMLAYQAARKIKEMANEAAAAAEMGQRMAIGFEAAAGGARAGAEAEAFLRAEGQRLGFVVNDMAEGYIKFLTATRGANMAQAEQQALFSRTVEAMVSVRAPQQQINQLLQTFAEIIDRGAASAAQLRRRLSDELPSGLANLRAVTGLTEGDLDKMTKGGQLGAQVLLSLITRVSEEMGGGFRSAIDSAAAAQGRLHDQMQASAALAGERYLPALAHLREELRLLAADTSSEFQAAGDFLAFMARGVENLIALERRRNAEAAVQIAQQKIDAGIISRDLALEKQGTEELAVAERNLADAQLTASQHAQQHAEMLHLEAMAVATSLPGLIARGEALQRTGRISQEEARIFVAELDNQLSKAKEFDAADRALMQSRLDRLLQLRDAFSPLTIDVAAAFEQQLLSVRHFVLGFEEELHRTGTLSKDAADEITKQVKAAAKSFDLLPEAVRKAHAAQGAELAAMLRDVERFTTGYEKEAEKQIRAAERVTVEEAKQQHLREKNLEESLRRIAGLIEKPIGKAETADLAGAQKSLEAQRAELAALKAKPTATPEEGNRMEELRLSIDHQIEAVNKLKRAQADQGSAALESASAQVVAQGKVHQAIANLVTEDDKFAASFNRLGPEGQASIQQILTGLDELDKSGRVTGQDVTTAIQRMADVFVQGGVAAADFAARLRADIDPTRTLAQMFDAVRSAGTAGAQVLSQVATAATQTGAASAAASAGVRTLTAAEKEQADIAQVVAFAQRTAGLASLDLAGKSPAVVAAFEAAAKAARDDARAADDVKAGSIEVSNAKGVLIQKTREAGEAWKTETSNIKENSEARRVATDANIHAQGVGEQGVVQLDKEIIVLSDGSLQWRKRVTQVKDSSAATKDATDKSRDLTTQVKAESTATNQLGLDLPRVITLRKDAGAAAEKEAASEQKGAAALGQLAAAAAAAAPPLEKVAGSMQKIAAADPGATLQKAADAERDLLASAEPLAVAIDKETFYLDALDAMVVRLTGHYRALTTARDSDRASMAAWRAEAELDVKVCRELTACLQEEAAA